MVSKCTRIGSRRRPKEKKPVPEDLKAALTKKRKPESKRGKKIGRVGNASGKKKRKRGGRRGLS